MTRPRQRPAAPGVRKLLTIEDTGVSPEVRDRVRDTADWVAEQQALKRRDEGFLEALGGQMHAYVGQGRVNAGEAVRARAEAQAAERDVDEAAEGAVDRGRVAHIDKLCRHGVISRWQGRVAVRLLAAREGGRYELKTHRGDVLQTGRARSSLHRWTKAPVGRRDRQHLCKAPTFDPKPVKTHRTPGDGGAAEAAEAGFRAAEAMGTWMTGAMAGARAGGAKGGGADRYVAMQALKVIVDGRSVEWAAREVGGRLETARRVVKTAMIWGLSYYGGQGLEDLARGEA